MSLVFLLRVAALRNCLSPSFYCVLIGQESNSRKLGGSTTFAKSHRKTALSESPTPALASFNRTPKEPHGIQDNHSFASISNCAQRHRRVRFIGRVGRFDIFSRDGDRFATRF